MSFRTLGEGEKSRFPEISPRHRKMARRNDKLLNILITAGPTREMLDPVRFLSNISTGHMGYAIARAAKSRKHQVTLISGPTALKPPAGVRFIPVLSARDMQKACTRMFPKQDVLVMTAAVCDFTASSTSVRKIRRSRTKKFILRQTPDIVAGLARNKENRRVIGFCLETENWLSNAKGKIRKKNLDGIVANYYTKTHVPFGDRKITTAFVDKRGIRVLLRNQSKPVIARKLLAWVEKMIKKNDEKRPK